MQPESLDSDGRSSWCRTVKLIIRSILHVHALTKQKVAMRIHLSLPCFAPSLEASCLGAGTKIVMTKCCRPAL
jgi:hypothetical protein